MTSQTNQQPSGSEFVKTTGFTLAVYSNKNSSLFDTASENILSKYKERTDKVGIIYDDFNADMNVVKMFKKKYRDVKTYHVAPRRTTLQMDDKKFMAKRMKGSKYDISDPKSLRICMMSRAGDSLESLISFL